MEEILGSASSRLFAFAEGYAVRSRTAAIGEEGTSLSGVAGLYRKTEG